MRAQILVLLALAAAVSARELQQTSTVGGKILNGLDAERGRFNYAASLRYPWADHPNYKLGQHVCAGALIRPDMVVTTAECAAYLGAWPKVRLSSYETDGGRAEVRTVVATAIHAGFAENFLVSAGDDVALMQLDRAAATKPVRVPPATPDPAAPAGTNLTIVGWGWTQPDMNATAKHLKMASQIMLTPKRCMDKWPFSALDALAGFDTLEYVCGAYSGHNKALCNGDLGAPLIRRGTSAAEDVVVGLGSSSVCQGSGVRGGSVFTSLSHYSGWITEGIRLLRRNKPSYGKWIVLRKADYPPDPTCTARQIGHACALNDDCCSGKCLGVVCAPATW